jgi:2-polyprenyl-3-methyl-5-hydroxy-6-metoxy-1,4-benzoquinol methylase
MSDETPRRSDVSQTIDAEAEISKQYFRSFASDYHRAFDGSGQQPLHALINKLFRRKTFTRRTDIVRGWLAEFGVKGKRVLDLGCGSGEVSIVAAELGATVTGMDIVPEMIAIARGEAARRGLSATTTFRVGNLAHDAIDPADVIMMIGVVEYYRDVDVILPRVAAAAAERMIVVDTRGPWWRRQLRYGLARFKRFHLYYHPPSRLEAILAGAGFARTHHVAGHSFTAMAFARTRAR